MKKIFIAITITSIVLLSCGCSYTPISDDSESTQIAEEALTGNVFLDAKIETVYLPEGQRAYISVDKGAAKKASQQDFADFLEKRVAPNEYKWFTVDFNDGTGICILYHQWDGAAYGNLDDSGKIKSTSRDGHLKLIDSEKYLVEYIDERKSYISTSSSSSSIITDNLTLGQKNAIKQANSYLNAMAFSRKGLIEQLEYEGYSNSDATYAVDHITVDWNDQATKKAKEYLNVMALSRTGLIEQLEYDGFTSSQAEYGVKAVGY